jgi:GDPmannose 4,6-dehydratase
MYACNGILFNHESPRRGETFVTRKMSRALANISQGLEDCLYVGNLSARRDWGHAKDYVRMQWLMLQQEKPEDFVIATGEQHSVCEFVHLSANELGIALEFTGVGVDEVAIVSKVNNPEATPGFNTGEVIVRVDPRYVRPTEVETLLGDPTRAKEKLGWVPEISFESMISDMVAHDLEAAKKQALLKRHGYKETIARERSIAASLYCRPPRDGGFGDLEALANAWL